MDCLTKHRIFSNLNQGALTASNQTQKHNAEMLLLFSLIMSPSALNRSAESPVGHPVGDDQLHCLQSTMEDAPATC